MRIFVVLNISEKFWDSTLK